MGVSYSSNNYSTDDYIKSFDQLKKGLEEVSLDLTEEDSNVLKELLYKLDLIHK